MTPKKDCAVRITCPVPLHSLQEIFLVPAFAPEPEQVEQVTRFLRRMVLEIPENAIREALVNAYVHRDYSNFGRNIKVAVHMQISHHILQLYKIG